MRSKAVYVKLLRRWDDKNKRWTSSLGTTLDRPQPHELAAVAVLACWEVDAVSKAEAPAIVVEWLLTERSRSMTVKELKDVSR